MTRWSPDDRVAAIDEILRQAPVLPVLTITRLDAAVPLARALVAGGLPVLEITLRSEAALASIARIRTEVPEAIVGAGTVLESGDLDRVIEAGASFAISPGASPELYAAASSARIPLIPGVATASELMHGLSQAHRRFKFFPAQAAGGMEALKAFAGPFAHVKFCPTGGINMDNATDYLALSNVLTVGGSWMVPADLVAAADWSRISGLARDCAQLRVSRSG